MSQGKEAIVAATMKYADVRLGTIEAVLNKLGGIEGAERFLRGDAEVVIKRHIIDLDAAPYCPDSWEVVEHVKGGQFEWDPAKVALYLDEAQRTGSIKGEELQKKLKPQPCFNANLLDYLLANPRLIPEEWKGTHVFFWNMVYRDSDGSLCVRSLRWVGDAWDWDYRWPGRQWDDYGPAAVYVRS